MPLLIDTASDTSNLVEVPVRDATPDGSSFSSPILFPNREEKHIFTVSPGQMAVLTGYTLETGGMDIYKVLINSGSDQVGGSPCCEPTKRAIPAKVALRSKVCAWRLEECNPVLVIKTPGVYELMPIDPNTEATVTLDRYPLQEINNEINSST